MNHNLLKEETNLSLTSMLKGRSDTAKEFQQIIRRALPTKELFQTITDRPAFSRKDYIAYAPYNLKKHYNASLVGIAFDYLARIIIAQKVELNKEASYEDLTGEYAIPILERVLETKPRVVKKVKKRVEKCKKNFKRVTQNKIHVKEVIVDACFLAKLEAIARTGIPPLDLLEPSFFNKPEDEIVNDLLQICEVFNTTFLPLVHADSKVYYNPNFGIASGLVRGADADIIIDGTLYDFKTGKPIGYKWQDIAQVLGYYLLNEIMHDMSEVDDDKDEKDYPHSIIISRLAIYRGRYGEIEYVNVNQLDKDLLKEAKQEMINYFDENNQFIGPYIRKKHILNTLATV